MLIAAPVCYASELLTDTLWNELVPLLHAHYDEVAHYKDFVLEPDRAAYERCAAAGMLRVFTARVDGKLIGYMVGWVAGSFHYQSRIYFTQDILFVSPSHRGTRIGVDLILYAHSLLRQRDRVDLCLQHTKAAPRLNIGRMLIRLLGYEKIDEVYGCRLDRE